MDQPGIPYIYQMCSLKCCSFVALLSLLTSVLSAQQIYTSQDYGGPGTIYLYNQVTGIFPIEEFNQTGSDIQWDLTAFNQLNTHPSRIITPSQGMDQTTFLTVCTLSGINPFLCFSIWSQTDQALLLDDSLDLSGFSLLDLQRYQNKTSNLLLENFFAFTVDFGGTPTQAAIVYQQPDTIYKFPITFGSSWTSSIEWIIDLSITGQNLIYKSQQHRSSEVTAWGTVFTPFDTFTNVIRLKSEIEHKDTLISDSLILPFIFTQVEYMWFDTNYKLPIMMANGIKTDTFELINSVEYIYEATCPAPTWMADAAAEFYYIDSTGAAIVDFNITNANAGIYTWEFGDGETTTSAGNISHGYTTPGYYTVTVTGCMTDCLPLNSCTAQLIDFEVIDTVFESAGPAFSDQQFIKIYPNPVEKYLHVVITGPYTFQYEIMTVAGQKLQAGSVGGEESIIPIENLPSALYLIRLYNQKDNSLPIITLKFLKKD